MEISKYQVILKADTIKQRGKNMKVPQKNKKKTNSAGEILSKELTAE